MPFQKLASLNELPPGTSASISSRATTSTPLQCGGRSSRYFGGLPASSAARWAQGALDGSLVTCPWHAVAIRFRAPASCTLDDDTSRSRLSGSRRGGRDSRWTCRIACLNSLKSKPWCVRCGPSIIGRRILNAEFRQLRVLRGSPLATTKALAGRRIEAVERYGKFIAIRLDRGYLVVHLGMTGKASDRRDRKPNGPMPFSRSIGACCIMTISASSDVSNMARSCRSASPRSGPSRSKSRFADFAARLKARRSPVKAVLLNQAVVRGVGNIYADEALFRAGVHPKRAADSLRKDRVERIYNAMREVLAGSHRKPRIVSLELRRCGGRKGSFQLAHRVYRRTGEPCVNCGAEIKRIVVAQRGTHFCPKCQR